MLYEIDYLFDDKKLTFIGNQFDFYALVASQVGIVTVIEQRLISDCELEYYL
jgi:hypothetical protein